MPGRKRSYHFKIALMGDPEVGKSSLVRRYVRHAFSEDYVTTIGTEVSKRTETFVSKDGTELELTIDVWDVMGQKLSKDLLREAYFYHCQGALGVFDVTRPETMMFLYDWVKTARKVEPRISIVILGNKVDLQEARRVSEDEARDFCNRLGLPYLDASAKTGLNVERGFRMLAEQILGRVGPRDFPMAARARG